MTDLLSTLGKYVDLRLVPAGDRARLVNALSDVYSQGYAAGYRHGVSTPDDVKRYAP